jgi:hypothetical protein
MSAENVTYASPPVRYKQKSTFHGHWRTMAEIRGRVMTLSHHCYD